MWVLFIVSGDSKWILLPVTRLLFKLIWFIFWYELTLEFLYSSLVTNWRAFIETEAWRHPAGCCAGQSETCVNAGFQCRDKIWPSVVWNDAELFRWRINTLSQRCGNSFHFSPLQASWRSFWTGGCSRTITVASVRASPTISSRRVSTTCCWRTGGAGLKWGGVAKALSASSVLFLLRLYFILFVYWFSSDRKWEERQWNICHCLLTWPRSPSATRLWWWLPPVTASCQSFAPSSLCTHRCLVTFTCSIWGRWRTRR